MLRKLLPILGLFLWVIPSYASSAHVQTQTCAGTNVTPCNAFSPNNVGGNTIIAVFSTTNTSSASPTIADTQLNTYTQKQTCVLTNINGDKMYMYEADSIAAGANTTTITGGVGIGIDGFVTEISGLAASSYDQFSCSSGNPLTTYTSGNTPSTTAANEILICLAGSGTSTPNTDATFTSRATLSNNNLSRFQTKNVSATGAQVCTGSQTSAKSGVGLFTFKDSAQGGTSGAGIGGTAGMGGKAGIG